MHSQGINIIVSNCGTNYYFSRKTPTYHDPVSLATYTDRRFLLMMEFTVKQFRSIGALSSKYLLTVFLILCFLVDKCEALRVKKRFKVQSSAKERSGMFFFLFLL